MTSLIGFVAGAVVGSVAVVAGSVVWRMWTDRENPEWLYGKWSRVVRP